MGQKVTIIDGLAVCGAKLTHLNLRSNLLRRMIGVRHAPKLEYLELYDNRIEALEDLEACGGTLATLDMSYKCVIAWGGKGCAQRQVARTFGQRLLRSSAAWLLSFPWPPRTHYA